MANGRTHQNVGIRAGRGYACFQPRAGYATHLLLDALTSEGLPPVM